MVINKQSWNWIVDAALFLLMLAEFFMNLTGMAVHQWMGVGLVLLAVYHLIAHWKWVKMAVDKFIHRASARMRRNLVVDAVITLGFILILVSGLVISTWLDLPLFNYYDWKVFHVTSSVVTLLAVVVKIGLHWKWIVKTSQLFKSKTPQASLPKTGAVPVFSTVKNVTHKTTISRRSFLTLMGLVSVSSALAIYEVLAEDKPAVQIAEAEPVLPTATTGSVSATATSESVLPTATSEQILPTAITAKSGQTRKRGNRATPTSAEELPAATADTITEEVIEPTITPQPTAAATTAATATSEAQACTVLCSRGCSYPGSCRRYTDQNNNGLCDLGECL